MTIAIPLQLETLDPIVISASAADSLSNETLRWIPGTALLGALATAAIRSGHSTPDDPSFTTIFCSDAVRFLDSHPVLSDRRTLPRPRSFATVQQPSDGTQALTAWVDRATQTIDGPVDRCTPALIAEQDPSTDWSPMIESHDHVGIDPGTRTAEEGILFAYEAMPAGIRLKTWILCDDDDAATTLKAIINATPQLRIGRSRSGGYGRVSLTASKPQPATDALEYRTAAADTHTITLLSDYCPHPGQSAAASLTQDLRDLGLTVTDRWLTTRTVQGFRGVWGLPRPSVEVIERGSVLAVTGDTSNVSPVAGIGQRRNEGFGRFALDWVAHQPTQWKAPPARTSPRSPNHYPAMPGGDAAIKAIHYRRRAAEVIDVAARAAASPFGKAMAKAMKKAATAGRHPLSISQWHGLHGIIASPDARKNAGAVRTWFDGVRTKSNREAWTRNKLPLGGDAFAGADAWMDRLLKSDDWTAATDMITSSCNASTDAWSKDDRHQLVSVFLHLVIRAAKAQPDPKGAKP